MKPGTIFSEFGDLPPELKSSLPPELAATAFRRVQEQDKAHRSRLPWLYKDPAKLEAELVAWAAEAPKRLAREAHILRVREEVRRLKFESGKPWTEEDWLKSITDKSRHEFMKSNQHWRWAGLKGLSGLDAVRLVMSKEPDLFIFVPAQGRFGCCMEPNRLQLLIDCDGRVEGALVG